MRKTIITALFVISTFAILPAGNVFAQAPTVSLPQAANVCDYAGKDAQTCHNCMDDGLHTWTAVGCIDTNPSGFMGKVLGLATGIGGGIAFLLILFGGFQILTSAGNPEKLNAGRELVGSAIAGLLLIIFSIFLLRLIGVNILGIPGFK